MKRTLTIIVAACGLTVAGDAKAAAATPRQYVIAIAPGLGKEKGNEVLKQSFDLLLNRAQPSDSVEFYDAPQLTKLASVVVPAGSARERANSREFAAKFGALKKFLTEPAVGEPKLAGQLRLPQLLDTVAKTREANQRTALILVGSPLFITTHPNEVAFNMESGLTPGDGMVTCSSALSLFGTAERKGQLQGVAIHWLTPSDAWATSEMHRSAVIRFWTVFADEQGATLATFSSDTAAVFDRAVRGEDRPLMTAKTDPNDRGLIMRPPPAFHRETVAATPPPPVEVPAKPPAELPKAQPSTVPPPAVAAPPVRNPVVAVPPKPAAPPPPAPRPAAPVRVEEPRPAPPPPPKPVVRAADAVPMPAQIPTPAVGNVGIAAVWKAVAGTDIDLWVAARLGMPEAYWHRPVVSRVTYHRDIRTAQGLKDTADWRSGWEYVEVQGAQISEPTVWLNVYEARGPVSGIVRVQFNGQTVDRPFQFNVTRGNHGRDSDPAARSHSPYWLQIDLKDFELPATVSRANAAVAR